MSELEIGLIAIGGVFLTAVVSYNKWQEYKAKKNVERAFASDHDDVLMTREPAVVDHGDRKEPSLTAQSEATAAFEGASAPESAAPAAADADAPEPLIPVPAQRELPVDELIDCVIPLVPANPLRGEKVLAAIQALRHVGNKPVHFVGQRTDGHWEPVAYGATYTGLCAGVQLANRSTALNEIEYSELVMRLRQIADELDAEPEVPDMTRVIGTARELQQFVIEYDAKLSVNVAARGAPWAIDTLLAALERHGFDLRPDGRLVMPDGDGGVLFSLSTNVSLAEQVTARLTLLLDVPCVAPARDGFGAMVACARMLAARLDGIVVDDAGQPLTDEALAEIATQVADFYAHMEEASVPAGSPRALRLFG
jgi:hypothetical protein